MAVSINNFLLFSSLIVLMVVQLPQLCLSSITASIEKRELSSTESNQCCPSVAFLPPFRKRVDLGNILNMLDMKVGVELGVQRAEYSYEILQRWGKAKEYVLVDLWRPQKNYDDRANFPHAIQRAYKTEATEKMGNLTAKGILGKFTICRNYTVICATRFPSNYFDFIYVDARHDYKGVLQDIRQWWPKLRNGGIMAGHDYTFQEEPANAVAHDPKNTHQDWTLNYDGTKDLTGRVVRGAVDDFFSDTFGDMNGCPRQVTVSYREDSWNTWAVRK